MKFLIATLLLTVAVATGQNYNDMGKACLIEHLKENGVLEDSFPTPVSPSNCFLVPTLLKTLEESIWKQLEDSPSIKIYCVKRELREKQFFNQAIKKEIIQTSTQLNAEEVRTRSNAVKLEMKDILDKVAQECDSDPTWAGNFDNILGITNTSQAVLEQNYCFLKNSVDKNLINVENLNVNPYNIDTNNVDCEAVLQAQKDEIGNKIRKEYQNRGMPSYKTDCVINKLNNGDFFDANIALIALEKLDLDPVVVGKQKENISKIIRSGFMNVLSCLF